jgi:hypothetical protein
LFFFSFFHGIPWFLPWREASGIYICVSDFCSGDLYGKKSTKTQEKEGKKEKEQEQAPCLKGE